MTCSSPGFPRLRKCELSQFQQTDSWENAGDYISGEAEWPLPQAQRRAGEGGYRTEWGLGEGRQMQTGSNIKMREKAESCMGGRKGFDSRDLIRSKSLLIGRWSQGIPEQVKSKLSLLTFLLLLYINEAQKQGKYKTNIFRMLSIGTAKTSVINAEKSVSVHTELQPWCISDLFRANDQRWIRLQQ